MLPPSLRRIQRLARLPIQRVAIRQLLERSASVSLGHEVVEFALDSNARGTTGSTPPLYKIDRLLRENSTIEEASLNQRQTELVKKRHADV